MIHIDIPFDRNTPQTHTPVLDDCDNEHIGREEEHARHPARHILVQCPREGQPELQEEEPQDENGKELCRVGGVGWACQRACVCACVCGEGGDVVASFCVNVSTYAFTE